MRNVRLVISLVLVLIMMSLSACGVIRSVIKQTEETTAEETVAEETTEAIAANDDDNTNLYDEDNEDDEGDNGNSLKLYDTVQEYAESDVIQESMNTLNESYKNQGLEVTITGEDNKLIYNYKYIEIVNYEGLAEALAGALTLDMFDSVIASIKLVVDEENPVVVVRYIDANDEEIYSQEFTKSTVE